MRIRTALVAVVVVCASCGRQAAPPTVPAAPDALRAPRVQLEGFDLDVRSPPDVPPELDDADAARAVAAPGGAWKEPSVAPALAELRSRASAAGLGREAPAKRRKWIVQLDGPVHGWHRARLEATGARLGDYLPDHAFVASMDDETRAAVERLPFVRGVARLKPAYKIARRLKDAAGELRKDLGERVRLRVRLDADDGLAPVVAELRAAGGEVLRIGRDVVQAEVPPAATARLARREEVLWVEEVAPTYALNDTSRWTIQSNVPGSTPFSDGGLDGSGEIVGVGDTGLDVDACWFRDPGGAPVGPGHRKVLAYLALQDERDGDFGHGTHVSGTVAGDQAPVTGGTGANGMAPRARLVVSDLTPGEANAIYVPEDLGQLYLAPYQLGARIHTNSWGNRLSTYEGYAWSTDRFTWEHKDLLVLFANGNSGPDGRVGAPATAKNVISVGATENGDRADHLASFSSAGPTADGRLKPTITAPGVAVRSADSDGIPTSNNCGVVAASGTSMATPTVAGAAALVRQYFGAGYWPSGLASPADAFAPSAALVKATLVNSAEGAAGDHTGGPIPSLKQGWGRVNLSNTLRFAADTRFLDIADVQPGVSTGDVWTKPIYAAGGQPLKITLVWTDYPGSQLAARALVNDLDLSVVAPDGTTTYLGNAFSEGASSPVGEADRLNVEEQVYLPTPVRGAYTIRVRGFNVPMGPQPFAVVAAGAGGVSSQGLIGLDRTRYGAATTVHLKVGDRDLNVSAAAPDEVLVAIRSDADPGGETVRLVETGADTSVFVGELPTASAPGVGGDGLLAVSEGGAIVATYLDADDGTGAPATATATAVGDLTAPVISSVSVVEVGQDFARVALAATEPVTAKVLYGPAPDLGGESAVRWLAATHEVRLGALEEGVEYHYAVQVTDEAGNVATDLLRSLTTLVLPPSLEVHSTRGELTNARETVLFGKALDPSGVTSLTLDGAAVSVRPTDGYFEVSVPLAIGENRLALVATDGLGQQATRIVVVTRLPLPDLTVRDVTAPELAGIGMPFVAHAEVCNLGQGEIWADSVTVLWYLWDEAASRGYLLKDRELWTQPPPGTCTPVSDPLFANSLAFLGGAYRLGVTVFSGDPEERDDNNDALSPEAIRFAPPDLAPAAVTAPAHVGTARPFDVATTIENRGLGKAIAVGVSLYLSDDDVITSADRLVASFQIGVLEGGSTVSTTTAVTLPTDVAARDYRVGVLVDADARIVEAEEGNNSLAGGIVTVLGPDLVAVSVEGPPTARTGDLVTFHDVVTAAVDGGDVGPFTVGLYASTDPLVTASDVKLGERAVASLVASASSGADVTVSIPATFAPGRWWVASIADPGGRVRETDEANNAAPALALDVTGPDLAVTTASAPGTAVVGGTIVVEDTVAAAADGGAAPAVDVLYYLSADEVITGADLVLGWRSVPALAPGGSSAAATTLTLPVGLPPGPYHVGVVVDDFTYCYEDEWETQYCLGGDAAKEPGDGANNVRTAGPVAVAGTDLRLTALSATGAAATGRPLVVRDTVVAAGGGAAGFRVGYYLSADAVVTTADTLLGSRLVPALPPGGESSGEVTVTVPVGLAPGAYTLGAIADHQRWVAEVDEANNAFAVPGVPVAGPDLVAGAPAGPQTLPRSVGTSFTTTVSNVGAGASPNALVWICLSADAAVTTTDRVIGSRLVAGLAPGVASVAPVTLTIPSDVAPGSYYLGAIVDPGNTVKEEVEANNASAATPITVTQ